jgi:hypothetical protein
MNITSMTAKPNPNSVIADQSGVAGAKTRIYLRGVVIQRIGTFLDPKGLARLRAVQKSWKAAIDDNQWAFQCCNLLGIPRDIDPKEFLSPDLSYEEGLRECFSKIVDREFYRRQGIGEIGQIPPVSETRLLESFAKPDPCDPSKTIGEAYTLMYIPDRVVLSEPAGQVEVDVTTKNLPRIFAGLKGGNPPKYSEIGRYIIEKVGDEKAKSRWVWMRKDVIGIGLSFDEQIKLAEEKGVVVTSLVNRIWANFVAGSYLDRLNPFIFARTSTNFQLESTPLYWLLGCGAGDSSGLRITHGLYFNDDHSGVAVELSLEVKAARKRS